LPVWFSGCVGCAAGFAGDNCNGGAKLARDSTSRVGTRRFVYQVKEAWSGVALKEPFPREKSIDPTILSPMNINPDSHNRTIWKSLVLRDRLGTPGDLFESFGTATWLENIVLKILGYPLTFLGKGTWLKSVLLKERLTIPEYLLHHPV